MERPQYFIGRYTERTCNVFNINRLPAVSYKGNSQQTKTTSPNGKPESKNYK